VINLKIVFVDIKKDAHNILQSKEPHIKVKAAELAILNII